MKIKFIMTNKKSEAVEQCPWSSKIVKVHGGYLCFESLTDYTVWKNQK
jgi:hypothetical protein